MQFVTCNSCGGTYPPVQADGLRYYHQCPPVQNPAHQPDPRKPLFDPRETIERAGARNENVRAEPTRRDGEPAAATFAVPISEGLGVTPVGRVVPAQPDTGAAISGRRRADRGRK